MAKNFWWTAQRLQALELDLQGRKTEEIAAAVGATVSTIEGWRRRSAWRDRRQQLDEAAMEVMRQRAVTRASAGKAACGCSTWAMWSLTSRTCRARTCGW